MAVRICYLSRGTLGASLRSLRLVGHGADEQWPDSAQPADVDAGAAWIRSRLASLRSTNSLALLCLDVEGGVCTWLSAPSGSPTVVAALARGGGPLEGESHGRGGTSAVDFYAGDSFASTIQALDTAPADAAGGHKRFPVLAIGDVPARLLMDSLDRVNISVEAAATLWHVMAHAWDPGAPRAGAPLTAAMQPTDTAADAPITGVVLVDAENARLLWTWSRAGRLLVAGSMRLRKAQAETNAIVEAGSEEAAPSIVAFGQDDVSRLTVEWLSWAAQVGQAPSRFVCVLPDPAQAAAFGRALGHSWTGSTVDVAVKPDPIGETLARIVTVLENTPKSTEDDPQLSLVELSSRPGRSHRQLYMWWSGAITAAAVVMGVIGYQMNASAEQAQAAASEWAQQQDKAIKQVLPDARPGPGRSIFDELRTEVTKREKETQAVKQGTDMAMPVFEELETLSFVVGNNGFELDSIDLDSQRSPRFTVITPTTRDAEDLLEAIKRVAGSNITDWTTQLSSVPQGETTKVRGTYTGQWIKKEGGSR